MNLFQLYLIISPIYMSNSKSFNSDIHSSEKTSQEISKNKYKKFSSTLKSTIHKEVSIESLMKNGKKSQRFFLQFSQQKNGMDKNKSETSLNGYKTPRKVPQTPRKQINTHTPVGKNSNPISLNELALKFKILIKDLEKLIISIQTELKKTIENILKNTHKQMLQFLTNQINSNRQYSSLKSLKESKVIDSSKLQKSFSNKYQLKILSEFSSQNKLIDTESVELNKSYEHIPKNLIENNELEQKGGANFSTMIKLREKIRKDANNPVRKNIKDKYKEQLKGKTESQLSITQSRGALSRTSRMQGNRVAACSIQKLQRQLNSLKNLLNEQ